MNIKNTKLSKAIILFQLIMAGIMVIHYIIMSLFIEFPVFPFFSGLPYLAVIIFNITWPIKNLLKVKYRTKENWHRILRNLTLTHFLSIIFLYITLGVTAAVHASGHGSPLFSVPVGTVESFLIISFIIIGIFILTLFVLHLTLYIILTNNKKKEELNHD